MAGIPDSDDYIKPKPILETGEIIGSLPIVSTEERLAVLSLTERRKGGSTKPVRVLCSEGHESGVVLTLRQRDDGIEMTIRPTYPGPVWGRITGAEFVGEFGQPTIEKTTDDWRLECGRCDKLGQYRSVDWLIDQAFRALLRWHADGQNRRIAFTWT